MEQASETMAASFHELVEACHDASVLFQPAKNALDDVALSLLGPIKQPGQAKLKFALHRAHWDDGLHSILVVVVA